MDSGNRQVLSDAQRTMALSEELHALPPPEAAERLRREPDELAARVLALLNPAEAVDVLDHVPPERRARVIAAAPGGRGEQWRIDLEYPETSVGRLMEAPLAVYGTGTTVREAIESLRELVQKAFITYIFVTDSGGRLVGVLAFRELLFAKSDQRLEEIMLRDPFSLKPDMPLVDAMRTVVTRHYPAYPVTDDSGRLVGMVRGQSLFERQAYEISAQAGSMVGVEKEERVGTHLLRSFRFRHPWLQLNLLTAFVAAAVVGIFQDTIDRLVVLAAFLPVLAGQSGNSGCQALAVTLRGLTLGELRSIPPRRLVHQGGPARRAERRPRRARRGRGDVVLRALAGDRARPDARRDRVVRDDRRLRDQRDLGGPGSPHAEASRGRSGDGLEHLPHDAHRRREHGDVARPRGAPDSLRIRRAT